MKNKDLVKKLESVRALIDQCLVDVRGSASTQKTKATSRIKREVVSRGHIDFGIPVRPFMKRYSKGMSGQKKFTLLLARLTQGDLKRQIPLADLRKQWGRIKGILGMEFNTFYSTTAGDNGWVECRRAGLYNLRSTWRHVLS